MSKVTLEIPATTANLGPGFDCVGLALGLCNRIEAAALDHAGWEISIAGAGEAELPRHRQNLVAQAMEEVFDLVGSRPAGVRLSLTNRIPLCSGLGSSAAARVGGIVAANELCGRPLSTLELARLAAQMEGHPDNVVPALVGGLVVAVLDGEQLSYVRFDPPPL
ncbi:MAG: homoserine kinase, partial [Armatimonadetes bacterium]|nr:homoserine kinase [Armatimonadota bacterium]